MYWVQGEAEEPCKCIPSSLSVRQWVSGLRGFWSEDPGLGCVEGQIPALPAPNQARAGGASGAPRGCLTGGLVSGGPARSGCPFALSPSHPLPRRASDPHRHQWSLGGGRREEAGTGGGVGEGGGGEGGRAEAGRPGDAVWRPQRTPLFSSACLVGAVSSGGPSEGARGTRGTGPTEDDVDLSVLHALGRSGCFSSEVPPPSAIPQLSAWRGGVGVKASLQDGLA